MRSFAELTEKSVAEAEVSGNVFRAAWGSLSLALWEYRLGHDEQAEFWSRRCLNYPDVNAPRAATVYTILAMACHRTGRIDEAREALATGREIVETKGRNLADVGTPVQGFWFDWAFARILLRECAAMVE